MQRKGQSVREKKKQNYEGMREEKKKSTESIQGVGKGDQEKKGVKVRDWNNEEKRRGGEREREGGGGGGGGRQAYRLAGR